MAERICRFSFLYQSYLLFGVFSKCHVCMYTCTFVGCYYFALGNIHPMYRSSLNSIQLLCLVEAPVLERYGHDKVLELAIKDIRKLEQVHMHKCYCIVAFQFCTGCYTKHM